MDDVGTCYKAVKMRMPFTSTFRTLDLKEPDATGHDLVKILDLTKTVEVVVYLVYLGIKILRGMLQSKSKKAEDSNNASTVEEECLYIEKDKCYRVRS